MTNESVRFGMMDRKRLGMWCYNDVKKDIKELIEEGWIRHLEVKKSDKGNKPKKSIYFPRDLADKEVEFTNEELPLNCHAYLAELWDKDKKLGQNANTTWETMLENDDSILCEQEKEILRNR